MSEQHKSFFDVAAERHAALANTAAKVAYGTPAHEALKAVSKAIGDSVGAAVLARNEAANTATNAEMYPAGRQSRIRGMRKHLSITARQNLDNAEILMGAAKELLANQASRKLDRRDAMTARADAQMALNSVKPEERATKMAELARGDNDVAALVASDWGRMYLDAKGARTADVNATHDAVVKAHLQAALQSGDDDRRAAAEAYFDPAPVQALAAARGAVGAAEGELDRFVSDLDAHR